MILILVCSCFLFFYACLIFYYYKGWKKIKVFSPQGVTEKTFISVIIPVRNEEKNIISLVDSLKQQEYPAQFYEVIFVDDYSTDKTQRFLHQYCSGNISWLKSAGPEQLSSKKKAIDTGIRSAKGTLIVSTDADCHHPATWLSTINEFHLKTESCFIAAPVKFNHTNSLLSIFQSLDFITLQGITGSGIANRFHFMCNGANLAYTRESFLQVNGFEGIDHIASGDDMLLMYKIWKLYPQKIEFLKSREAIVSTVPMSSWNELLMQRKRWAGKALVYDDYRMVAVLFFVYLLNLSFISLIFLCFFNSFFWMYAGLFLVIKTFIEWPFVYTVAGFYGEQRLMKYFLWMQPIHIFYTVVIGIIGQLGKYQWKGRRTK
jgi:cellulose synthase/poly-beta-1,6-N-acetylglucosamine synthase-like glycosyltransferase